MLKLLGVYAGIVFNVVVDPFATGERCLLYLEGTLEFCESALLHGSRVTCGVLEHARPFPDI